MIRLVPFLDHVPRARLTSIARAQGLGPEDARDAVQEAMARVLEMPKSRAITNREEMHALLSVVVLNVARNMRRRHHRAKPHNAEVALELVDAKPAPDQILVVEQDRAVLEGCLGKLDEVQRDVVSLRIISELPGKEVAKRLEMTPGHVAVVLHRAKRDLERCVTLRTQCAAC
jgi:RNA polymerase sigma-70 factor, ECF subfamily